MTILAEILDDFSGPLGETPKTRDVTEDDLETQKLEAFESGYKAGWDDSSQAMGETRTRISEEFSQNLQDLSFTYHEAYNHIISATAPLFKQIVDLLLPKIAQQTLGLHVAEQLQSIARKSATQDVQILISEENEHVLSWLLEQDFGFPIELKVQTGLTNNQALIQFSKAETQIDLDEVVDGIGKAIQGFLHENKKALANG